MRSSVAILLTVVLAFFVIACSLMGCALAAGTSDAHACCHKHHSSEMPCAPKTKVQQCAYSLLDKGKTVSAGVAAPVLAVNVGPRLTTTEVPGALPGAGPQVDSSGLYLKIRVLLI